MSNYIFKIPKVSLALQTPADKHGECGIYIRIPFDGRYLRKATNIYIRPEHWDGASQRVKDRIAREEREDPDFIAYAHKVNELFYNKGKYGFTSWYNKKRYIIAFEFYLKNFTSFERPRLSGLKVEMFDGYVNYRMATKGNTSREGINKTLGHSSIATTEKTYVKFLKEKVHADMQVLEGFNF